MPSAFLSPSTYLNLSPTNDLNLSPTNDLPKTLMCNAKMPKGFKANFSKSKSGHFQSIPISMEEPRKHEEANIMGANGKLFGG